jgi:hypothetical protein
MLEKESKGNPQDEFLTLRPAEQELAVLDEQA